MDMTTSKTRRGRPRLRPSDSEEDPAEQILSAAGTLFVANGYSATSLAAIAAEAGLQRASLYHHFASKDAMLAEIGRRHVSPLLDVLSTLAAEEQSPALQLHRYLRIDLRHMLGSPFDLGALFHLPELRDRVRFDAIWSAVDDIAGQWQAWIEQAIELGEFVAIDPRREVFVLEGSYLGVLATPRSLLRDDALGTADAFAAFALRALLRDGEALGHIVRRSVELDGADPAATLSRSRRT